MRPLILLLLALGHAVSASAQTEQPAGPLTDPAKILAKASAALKALQRVRYQVEMQQQEDGASMTGTVTRSCGTARPPRLRIESGPLTLGSDGSRFWILDATARTARWATSEESLEALEAATRFELALPFLFQDGHLLELARQGQQLRLVGRVKIGQTPCYKLSFQHTEEDGEAMQFRLCVSEKDFLPRHVEAVGQGSITLSKVSANPKIALGAFALKAPKGYKTQQIKRVEMPKVGATAPNWTLKTADGKAVALSALKGKIVVWSFWASW